MIINDVNSLMRWQFGGLPSAYQEVEYITSHKQELIDTGYYPTSDTGFEIKWNVDISNGSSNYGAMLASRTSSYMLQLNYGSPTSTEQIVGHITNASTTTYTIFFSSNPNTPNEMSLHFNVDSNKTWKWQLNSQSNIKTNRTQNLTSSASLVFFGGNNTTLSGVAPFKKYDNLSIYYFRLTNELVPGEITYVRDYVPCYRKSDGVIGMYDLCGSICSLTGTPFYINAMNSGAFTKGPNV